MLRKSLLSVGLMAIVAGTASTVWADAAIEQRAKVNQSVIGIMAGRPGSTDLDLAFDLDTALSDGYNLRIVPMVSQGSAKEVEDLLYLRGVDLAVVQHDVVAFMDKHELYPNIKSALRQIASLGMEQFHVVARKDIGSIYDLAGKKVNFNRSSSGTAMTASVVFDALGIPVEVTNHKHELALDLVRKGELDAMVRTSGAPVPLFQEIDADDGLHFLAVPVTSDVAENYVPISITSEHYPELLQPGQSIETLGVATVLLSYNWQKGHPRGENLNRFTKQLFANFDELLEPGYHESWSSVDLSQQVPGIARHWSAEEALQQLVAGR